MDEASKNKKILKEAFEKWDETKANSEGIAHWMDVLSDNIVFKSLADGAEGAHFTNRISSKMDMQRYFEGLTSTMDMIYYKVDHYVAEGNKVVAVGMTAWKVKESGVVIETPKCDVVTFENGKIVSFFEYYDTAKMLDASPD